MSEKLRYIGVSRVKDRVVGLITEQGDYVPLPEQRKDQRYNYYEVRESVHYAHVRAFPVNRALDEFEYLVGEFMMDLLMQYYDKHNPDENYFPKLEHRSCIRGINEVCRDRYAVNLCDTISEKPVAHIVTFFLVFTEDDINIQISNIHCIAEKDIETFENHLRSLVDKVKVHYLEIQKIVDQMVPKEECTERYTFI